MVRAKRTQQRKRITKSASSLLSAEYLSQCRIPLWSPLATVGTHPQWAHLCAIDLDSALNYLRETEPLALEPVVISENSLCVVPCENSPLVRVQFVHVSTSPLSSPLPHANATPQHIVQEPFDALSQREIEILRLLATGCSNQGIADILIIAASTVKWYLKQIYSKLGVHRRTQAVAHARQCGLLE